MRDDMKKVLTTPAKYGGGNKGRRHREHNRLHNDPDNMPVKESMRKKHLMNYSGKCSASFPAPFRRFLNKNAGRSWNKVYSEVCEHADSRSMTGYNLREHIKYYVEINVVIDGKTVYYLPAYGTGYVELRKGELYVDHEDGLLKKYKRGKKYKYKFQAYDELPLAEQVIVYAEKYSVGHPANAKCYQLELRNDRLFRVTWKENREHLKNYTPCTAAHAEAEFGRYNTSAGSWGPIRPGDWRDYYTYDRGMYAMFKRNMKVALKSDEPYIKRMAELVEEHEQKRNKKSLSPEEILAADKRQRKII